jgi:predicted HicB family RNase H-like nuclease
MKSYKGYQAQVAYDADAEIFHGTVPNIRGVITFEGSSVDELATAFRDSVDFYLELCERNGVEPAKPYSGNFVVRIDPELHARVASAAAIAGVSLNSWVGSALEAAVAASEPAGAKRGERVRPKAAAPRRRRTTTVESPAPTAATTKPAAKARARAAKSR